MAKQEVLEARHPDYTPNKLFKENCEDVHCKENTRVKSLTLPAANTEIIKQNVIALTISCFLLKENSHDSVLIMHEIQLAAFIKML